MSNLLKKILGEHSSKLIVWGERLQAEKEDLEIARRLGNESSNSPEAMEDTVNKDADPVDNINA